MAGGRLTPDPDTSESHFDLSDYSFDSLSDFDFLGEDQAKPVESQPFSSDFGSLSDSDLLRDSEANPLSPLHSASEGARVNPFKTIPSNASSFVTDEDLAQYNPPTASAAQPQLQPPLQTASSESKESKSATRKRNQGPAQTTQGPAKKAKVNPPAAETQAAPSTAQRHDALQFLTIKQRENLDLILLAARESSEFNTMANTPAYLDDFNWRQPLFLDIYSAIDRARYYGMNVNPQIFNAIAQGNHLRAAGVLLEYSQLLKNQIDLVKTGTALIKNHIKTNIDAQLQLLGQRPAAVLPSYAQTAIPLFAAATRQAPAAETAVAPQAQPIPAFRPQSPTRQIS
jgi:hypothetical protein